MVERGNEQSTHNIIFVYVLELASLL